MKRSKLGILALAAAGGALALAPSAANASSIDGVLNGLASDAGVVGQSAAYTFNDQDVSNLYRTGANAALHPGELAEGDVLAGSFKFTSLFTTAGTGATQNMGISGGLDSGNAEVTGIYAIQVDTIVKNGTGVGSTYTVTFKPVDVTPGVFYSDGTHVTDFSGIASDGQTMFKVYGDASEDTGNSRDGGGFTASAASNGDLFASVGITGAADIYSITLKDIDLANLATNYAPGQAVSTGNLANLSITDDGLSDGGEGIGDFATTQYSNGIGQYDVDGTLSVLATSTQGTFGSANTFSFQLTVVPVPASVWTGLALMGLLGAGMVIRRRRQMA